MQRWRHRHRVERRRNVDYPPRDQLVRDAADHLHRQGAEAALQIMGRAGGHQVPKTVNQALASGFGGTMWTVLTLLTREAPW